MRRSFGHCFIPAGIALMLLVGGSGASRAQAQDKKSNAGSYDPRDLNGVWVREGRPRVVNPDGSFAPQTPGPIAGLDERVRPPFTAWGKAQFDAHIPTVGPRVQPGKENDPTMHCDPDGFPKIFTSPEPFEMVLASKRMFQFFEKDHLWREIWLDGRELPKDPDPTWNGTSVGHWEGNVLVVESDGFNDGTWLDYPGNPHSDQMHLTERYERTGVNTMTLTETVVDPKAYTAPWVGKPQIYTRHPDWEIHEWYCTHDEMQGYDDSIRFPAGEK